MDKDPFHKSPPPNEIVSRPDQETPGKEGTMGGTPPLNARAGIQSARKDGVLDVVYEKQTMSDNAVAPHPETNATVESDDVAKRASEDATR